MDASRNYYAILGIPPEASIETIREAYRMLARRFHPDANRNEGADHQFRDIAAAYETLGDPLFRSQYDMARRVYQDEPNYFTLRVTPSKRALTVLDEPQVLYLLLEILPLREQLTAKRVAPLNLTLVLDRSTSMRGVRLDKVKIAAQQIIEQLSTDDILSVISFSDRAEVLIPAGRVADKAALRSVVSIMRADGGTEILHGLQAGVAQCRKYGTPRMVNHVILLTDGRTFGDEERCLDLARQVAREGIGVSAMGIGEEWNDTFLDSLAGTTGGTSAYINTPAAVVRFLNEKVRSLGDSFVERLHLSITPDADIQLESVFKLQPISQPIAITPQPIPLGGLEYNKTLAALIQIQMPPSRKMGFRTVTRIDVTGDVLPADRPGYKVLSDISVEISDSPPAEDPPPPILHALGKLTLYRMQQQAEVALAQGNVREATRRLENLATRFLAAGQDELAQQAMVEAHRVSQTSSLSEAGRKTLKYQTRSLLALPEPGEDNA
jgi:Ca-activated chloride channel homolog